MRKRFRRGVCLKCKKNKRLSRHHVLPLRHYGENNSIILLCFDCHREIEKLIPRGKRSKQFYRKLTKDFLGGVS